MKPKFSFQYGEKEYSFSAENNAKITLEDGISVAVEAKAYPAFDAVEWVVWFENASEKNSEIFSEINDIAKNIKHVTILEIYFFDKLFKLIKSSVKI